MSKTISADKAVDSWALRTNVQQHELPPPNESCMHISELRFGRSEYEEEINAWYKACNKAKREDAEPPPHWRTVVKDPYALRSIYLDPTGDWLTSHKFLPVQLWCPDTMYTLLLSTPAVLQATQVAIEGGGGVYQMRRLEQQVALLFRTEYKRIWHEAESVHRSIPDREPYLQPTIEQHWMKAARFFDMAVPIIARWLLLHHCSFPEQWAVLIARHVKFGIGWQNYAERVASAAASGNAMRPPSKVVRLPRGANQQTFSTVKTSPESEATNVSGASPTGTGIVRIKRVREQP